MGEEWTGISRGAAKIALAYVLLSVSWILITDWWLQFNVRNQQYRVLYQTGKGLTFVSLSGLLIYVLVRHEQRRLAATNANLERTVKHATVLHRLLRHNLRNSCDVIQNNVELLQSGRGDPATNRERIRRQASKMSTIAAKSQHLRDVVSDGDPELVAQDLGALVDEAVTAVRREHSGATITVASSTDQHVLAHPRLSIAVEELLTNAVVHHETDAPRVTVAFDRDGDEAVLRVRDDGPGLPDIERTVLADGVENSLTHSRGIGLWIVRFVVTASGGSLSVPESDGDGTVVAVRLPVADSGA